MRVEREVVDSTKSHHRLAVSVSHSVATKFVIVFFYPFCSDSTERVFNMKKFFPKLSVRDICLLGLLLAITALLSIFCTFRIGTLVKIPLKFISVFVTAALYGPVWGGICAGAGDILNCLLAPVGPFVPQITALEFISGFIYGIFFFNFAQSKKSYTIRAVLCSLVQFFMAIIINTVVYTYWLGWVPDFFSALALRLPASLANFFLQIIVLISGGELISRLKGLKSMGVKDI